VGSGNAGRKDREIKKEAINSKPTTLINKKRWFANDLFRFLSAARMETKCHPENRKMNGKKTDLAHQWGAQSTIILISVVFFLRHPKNCPFRVLHPSSYLVMGQLVDAGCN
jgi:hypothetical protein